MSDLGKRRLAWFGEAVRTERKRLGLAQKDLAYAADMCQSEVCRIELGKQNCSLLSLHRIADGLGVSLGYLLAEARRAEEAAA